MRTRCVRMYNSILSLATNVPMYLDTPAFVSIFSWLSSLNISSSAIRAESSESAWKNCNKLWNRLCSSIIQFMLTMQLKISRNWKFHNTDLSSFNNVLSSFTRVFIVQLSARFAKWSDVYIRRYSCFIGLWCIAQSRTLRGYLQVNRKTLCCTCTEVSFSFQGIP